MKVYKFYCPVCKDLLVETVEHIPAYCWARCNQCRARVIVNGTDCSNCLGRVDCFANPLAVIEVEEVS